MKIGLLVCDQVQPQLQREFGDYPQMFKSLLRRVDNSVALEIFNPVQAQFPADINQCDVYMTTGSKWGVNDDLDWIKPLLEFIRQLYRANKGLAGVCFGHQLIAKALGGSVETSDKGWGIGIASSNILRQQPWMLPAQTTLDLVVSHREQITRLPQDCQVLASNEFCPFSMIQVSNHFLGIQGHPEFCRPYSLALINSRRDKIPAETVAQGITSLQHHPDSLLATKWILNFLRRTMDHTTNQ